MTIAAMADRLCTVYRRTAYVLEPVAATVSPTADRNPARDALLEVVLSGGTSNTGTVTVTGTGPDGAVSEVFTFAAGALRRVGVQRFSTISSIATSGLADEATPPTLAILAVGSDGSRMEARELVVSDWPLRKDAGPATWPAAVQGSTAMESTRFYLDWTTAWAPRRGDILVDGLTGEEWTVEGDPRQHGGGMRAPHHVELRVRLTNGAAGA